MNNTADQQSGQALRGANAKSSGASDQMQEDEIDLYLLWSMLKNGKWKIASFVIAALACAVFYLFITQPTYKADALVQIEPKDSSQLAGITSDLSQLTGKNSSPAQSEIPIIKSRSVIGDTITKLKLQTTVTPDYFPVIGWGVASRREAGETASTPINADTDTGWFAGNAWSPVHIALDRFEIPERLNGKAWTLRALGGNKFSLIGPEGARILEGTTGQLAKGRTPQGEPVRLFVSQLWVSHPPTDFKVAHSSFLPVVQSLQGRLGVSEQGDETGVVRIDLEGTNRAQVTEIVNSVADNYLRQNVEARSQQAQKSLEFLDKQLPGLRAGVQKAETKLANYQEKNNSAIDLGEEGKALLEQSTALENRKAQLQIKLSELTQTYTGKHPELLAAREQMQQIKAQRKRIESQVGKLPDAQREVLGLRRELQVNTQLYTALLNRAQELRVAKAGTVGNVRIIDRALKPIGAIAPKKGLVLALALVLGGVLGCMFVFLQRALRRNVDDPKDIENSLGLSVFATIPFSRWLEQNSRRARRRRGPAPILARDRSSEMGVEALRSLQTSLYFARLGSESNAILITGPAPGVGKSFVSINLAYLLADVGQKVIVVDADMRKGRLHEFAAERQREPGLSQVLTGQATLEEAVRDVDNSNVKILSTGQLPPNPAALLMQEAFPQMLKTLQQEYDTVIVDAAPVLAVTDASVIAASVPGIVTFMVARAGMHVMGELEESVNRMARQGCSISGVVFNGYRKTATEYTGQYGYYQYEYKGHSSA